MSMFFIDRPNIYFNVKEMDLNDHPLHLHNYFEIIHLLIGSIKMSIGSKHFLVQKGEYIYIPPHVPHAYQSEPDILLGKREKPFMRVISCCVDIFPLQKKNLLEKIPISPVLHHNQVHPDLPYIEKRLTELELKQDNLLLISSLISLALCRIFPYVDLVNISKVTPDNLVSGIITYIANHYLENISLNKLSLTFGISKYKISRIFSIELGTTFSSYVNSLRMNYACYLLVSTNYSITHIYIDCGYNNQQTFNRIFKNQNGCTPKEYRAKHNRDTTQYLAFSISFPMH